MLFKKNVLALVLVIAMVFSLAAWGGAFAEELPAKDFYFISTVPQTDAEGRIIYELTQKYIEEKNPNFTLTFEYMPEVDMKQKISTLDATGDLPDMWLYSPSVPLNAFSEAGKLVNMEEAFTELGVIDQVRPAAVNMLKLLSSTDKMYCVSVAYGCEGFWYNKKMFADLNLEVPKTLDEFVAVCEALKDAGIQPLSVAGAEGWQATRIANGYILRKLGLDAMKKLSKGELAYDHPVLLEAIEFVKGLNDKGYMGESLLTVQYGTSIDLLITGQAAMHYNGSWILGSGLTDPEVNLVGEENIGIFNFPSVPDGVTDAWFASPGNCLVFSVDKYDDVTKDWMQYVFSRYGDYAMENYGVLSGFTYEVEPKGLSPITQDVINVVNSIDEGGLWFEAFMPSKQQDASWSGIQSVFTGSSTPTQFWETLEAAKD